jgi:hypothetical protein
MYCGTWQIAANFWHRLLTDEHRQRKYFARENMGVINHPNLLA